MKIFSKICLLFALCPLLLVAQSPLIEKQKKEALEHYQEDTENFEGNDYTSELMKLVVYLILILLAVIFSTYYIKRLNEGKIGKLNDSSTIKVMEQRQLSHKAVLYLVEVYDKQVLVGETATGIAALAEFPLDEEKSSFQQIMERKG